MKFEELSKPLSLPSNSVRAWVATIANPLSMCRSILDETSDTTDAVIRALKIWFIGALITILFAQGAIYRFYNINSFSVDFYLSITSILLIGSFLLVIPVHFAFFIFRLPISFRDTFITFLVLTSTFFPLIALASTPQLVGILEILNIIKTQDIDLSSWDGFLTQILSVLEKRVESNKTPGTILLYLNSFASAVTPLLFAIQISIIFNFLSERSEIERHRVFDAGTFGLVMGGSLLFFPMGGYLFTLYTFLGK